MPRGLYGRAALILLLPIITLQLVVSVVFIQRHYEDVTRQMTQSLALDLKLMQGEINRADTTAKARNQIARIGRPLQLSVKLPAGNVPAGDSHRAFDFSGRMVVETLHRKITKIRAIDLVTTPGRVLLWVDTKHGVAKFTINRGRVAASNPHQFLVLMVFVGVLMTIVAFLYLRNQLRPIKRLARAAAAFGRGQVVEYRPSGAIEVRAAGNAFLDMRARIERQIEQRTLMLSGVSHDLRTPLTRFRLGLSMLDGDAEIIDLERDIADMEKLLDAFLAFARDDTLDDPQECDPILLVQGIVEKTAKTGGAVRVGDINGSGQVMLRPVAIERALQNLIGNALRYATHAVVSVSLTQRSVKFSVEDDGPGIAPEMYEEALKPFSRLDQARNQDQGSGVGLGLSIAFDIARRHGGTLRLGKSMRLGGLQVDMVLPR